MFSLGTPTGETVWEIPVEVPDPTLGHWRDVIARANSEFWVRAAWRCLTTPSGVLTRVTLFAAEWGKDDRELAVVASQIQRKLQELNQAGHRREFFLGFSEDPFGFFGKLLESQQRDLVVRGGLRVCLWCGACGCDCICVAHTRGTHRP